MKYFIKELVNNFIKVIQIFAFSIFMFQQLSIASIIMAYQKHSSHKIKRIIKL